MFILAHRDLELFDTFQKNHTKDKQQKVRAQTKTEYCREFILNYANKANPIADRNGVNADGRPAKELPFRSVMDFHKEFIVCKTSDGMTEDFLPKIGTFKHVFQDKEKKLPCELRFLRCKGAHASCEICVNASKLLENRSKRLDHMGKQNSSHCVKYKCCMVIFSFCNIACDLIRSYRHAHLKEQSQTRDTLNKNREDARSKKHVYILGDFMSEWATKLPHIKSKGNRTSKADVGLNMGCRLYAAEVIYGDKLEGFLCYLVPGHLPGGKNYLYNHDSYTILFILRVIYLCHSLIGMNVIVELTKRVLEDTNELIKQIYKEDMPAKLSAYFDNGSECKNYAVMSYFSLLVEMGVFSEIDLNYLIAG